MNLSPLTWMPYGSTICRMRPHPVANESAFIMQRFTMVSIIKTVRNNSLCQVPVESNRETETNFGHFFVKSDSNRE